MRKLLFYINLILILVLAVYIGKWHFNNYIYKSEAEQLIQQYITLTTPTLTDPVDQTKKLLLHNNVKDVENISNEIIGRIRIPSISLDYPVLASTNNRNMKIGITKFLGPDIDSTVGNLVLAGHNMRKSGVLFSDLYKLKLGQQIILYDMSGNSNSYTIFEISVVTPDCIEPLSQDILEKKWVTLITCSDMGKKRLIIQASK